MDARNTTQKPTSTDSIPQLEPSMLAMAKFMNKEIDPDLEPIFVSGAWVIDGMTSSNRSENKLMGGVNIGNRIFTDDTVTLLGGGKYKISSKSDFYSSNRAQLSFLFKLGIVNAENNNALVKASIDGNQYAGKEILIDKRDVYVDGNKMTANNELSSNKMI